MVILQLITRMAIMAITEVIATYLVYLSAKRLPICITVVLCHSIIYYSVLRYGT